MAGKKAVGSRQCLWAGSRQESSGPGSDHRNRQLKNSQVQAAFVARRQASEWPGPGSNHKKMAGKSLGSGNVHEMVAVKSVVRPRQRLWAGSRQESSQVQEAVIRICQARDYSGLDRGCGLWVVGRQQAKE